MQLNQINLSVFALLLSLTSCNVLHLDPVERAELSPVGPRGKITAFHENSEIADLEFKDPGDFNAVLKDVDRKRSGVRASYGIEYVQGYVELFDAEHLGSGTDGTGVGIGAMAEIPVYEFGDGASLFVPYQVGASLSGGESNFGGAKADFATLEVIAELGIGVDYRGFRPVIGVTSKSLRGMLDFDGEIETADEDDFDDIKADNTAGYLELGYRSRSYPIEANVRAIGGDESGVNFNLSFLL